jgi:hypothetical protein
MSSNGKRDRFDELVAPFLLGNSGKATTAGPATDATTEAGPKTEPRSSYRGDLLRTATTLLAAMGPEKHDPREAVELAAELIARVDEAALTRRDER